MVIQWPQSKCPPGYEDMWLGVTLDSVLGHGLFNNDPDEAWEAHFFFFLLHNEKKEHCISCLCLISYGK